MWMAVMSQQHGRKCRLGTRGEAKVAVRHLGEAALEWHQRAGGLLAEWFAWSEGLRGAFQPKLSLPEWCNLVGSRVQRPGEAVRTRKGEAVRCLI